MTSTFTFDLVQYDPTGTATPVISTMTVSTMGRVWSDVSAGTVQASTISAQNWVGLPAGGGSGNSLFWTSALSVQQTGSNVTLDLPATVTAGSYNSVNVDKYGRVTAGQQVSYGGGGGGPTYSFTSLSATTGYAALSLHDSEMSFTLSSGKLYRFRANYIFMTQATTTGFRFGISCPAFTVLAGTGRVPVAAGGTSGVYHSYITASGVSVTGTGVALAGVNYLAELDGLIQPSAGGSLIFGWASEINASRVTLAAGSCAELWQLTT